MSRSSWPLGRIILQLVLIALLFGACIGVLGSDGVIGVIMILGFVIVVYAITRAAGGGRR